MSGVFSKDEHPQKKRSNRKFGPGECLDNHATLQKKLNELASSWTNCCDKNSNCLKSSFNFTKSFLPGAAQFDYLEAKKCFESYLGQYQPFVT